MSGRSGKMVVIVPAAVDIPREEASTEGELCLCEGCTRAVYVPPGAVVSMGNCVFVCGDCLVADRRKVRRPLTVLKVTRDVLRRKGHADADIDGHLPPSTGQVVEIERSTAHAGDR